MMPQVVDKLPLHSRNRFNLAYDNSKRRPISRWETDDLVVGIIQAWLVILGESLPKSTSVQADGDIETDGDFGGETHLAVQSFQRKKHIKDDGMVGHDTLDALGAAVQALKHVKTTKAFIKKPNEVRRACPPGAPICPDRF
jgi:peptidoglycan hydrolase-like protein with peptidoglycan-binding domain